MSFFIGFIFFIFAVALVYFIVKVSDMEERLEEVEEKLLSQSSSAKPAAAQEHSASATQEPDFKTLLEKQKNRTQGEGLPVILKEEGSAPLAPLSEKEEGFFARLTAAKVFSVVGGFALILGVIFAFKYYQQHVSALARFATALLFGAALLTAGLINRIAQSYKITAITLCAAGIATMYAAFYAGFAFYHIIPLNISFICMTAVSLLSFAVALKKDSSYVGMLSVIMAFLIPVLLSTGKAMYMFLFAYIGIINLTVFCVALYKKWSNLIYTALAFTILGQLFAVANSAAISVFYIFALYIAGGALAVLKTEDISDKVKKAFGWFICGNIILTVFYTGLYLKTGAVAVLFAFIFFSQILLTVIFNKYPKMFSTIFKTAGAAVFLIIISYLNGRAFVANYYFNAALFIVAAIISLAGNFIDSRKNEEAGLFDNISSLLPVFVMFFALTQFYVVSTMGHLIPLVFLLCLPLLFGLCGLARTGTKFARPLAFAAVVVAGVWVLLGEGACCYSFAYSSVAFLEIFLFLYGIIYIVQSVRADVQGISSDIMRFSYVLMPYLAASVWMYIWVKPELHYAYGAFSLIASLVVVNAAFSYEFKDGRPLAFSAVGVLFACATFYALHLSAGHMPTEELLCGSLKIYGGQALAGLFIKWIIVIYGAILLLPFIFKKRFLESKEAWAAAAFGGVAAFMLIYVTAKSNFALCCLGLIPLIFALVYMLAEAVAFKWQGQEEGIQAFRLSVLGGALLFFITAVPAVALKKEWLTMALAAEGVLLLWMNGRLKQNWVKYTAIGLLSAVFARLILNPAIFVYYPSGAKIFNWYLYTYLFAALAMFAAAKLYKDEEQYPVRAALNAFGAILLFALVNIEIADFYAVSGPLKFKIFGGFAETVTYTLAWAVFGTLCLTSGIIKRSKILLFCGGALISVATAKVFFFDLWSLGAIYRLAGLFGIAAVLIFAGMMLEKFKAVLKSFDD